LDAFYANSLSFAATFSFASFHLISFFVDAFASASNFSFSTSRFLFFLETSFFFLGNFSFLISLLSVSVSSSPSIDTECTKVEVVDDLPDALSATFFWAS
jgi:hypothetical protein